MEAAAPGSSREEPGLKRTAGMPLVNNAYPCFSKISDYSEIVNRAETQINRLWNLKN